MMKNLFEKVLSADVPEVFPAEEFTYDNEKALFFTNVPWKGKETRAFAWMGFPEHASKDHPVPGIVLVHGGGGTALANWVELWVQKGYAVIAMDNCGGVPGWSQNPYYKKLWPRHEFSGPAGWGRFDECDLPAEDQWMYHAVSSALRGKKLLSSFEQVDGSRIGVTGISWGGVISCIVSSLEEFAFCSTVYGCGGFDTPESGIWKDRELELYGKQWMALWDPDRYLISSRTPTLFLNSAGDSAFPLDRWCASSKLPQGMVRRSLRPEYQHNHTISWSSNTMFDFAESVLKNRALPDAGTITVSGNTVSAPFTDGGRKIVSADFFYTRAEGNWTDRKWNRAEVKMEDGLLKAELPPMTKCCFFVLNDENSSKWSSDILKF